MATEDESDYMASRFDLHRPISSASQSPPSKPEGGARILSFLLQAVVMAIALSLFFLFAGLAALILLHLFVAGRALRRRRRRLHSRFRHPPDVSPFPSPPPGLSPDELRDLPSFRFSREVEPPPDCAVCLEGFREGDRCRNLPRCGHSFHLACVDRWLARSPACPICRGGVETMDPVAR